jgi:two-component system sensor histidine kinase CpxA
MINLNAKIFLGFWLSTIAIIGSWLLAGEYFDAFPSLLEESEVPAPENIGQGDFVRTPTTPGDGPSTERRPRMEEGRRPPPRDRVQDGVPQRPRREPPRGEARPRPQRDQAETGNRSPRGGPSPRDMYRIFYELQNVGEARLPQLIKRIEASQKLRVYLIDDRGQEIFGKTLETGTNVILRELDGFRRRTQHREAGVTLIGQKFYRSEWGQLTLVIASDPPASPIIKVLTEQLWLRLLLALVISGLISFLVSRYLTRPLKRLQLASRQLALGDLAVRIDVPEKGGDETDELARDFNSMAEQLEEKIQAQRRLLNDVSHELRSPLARLRVAIALAERDPESIAQQLARMERETERLDELIGQLLAIPDAQLELEDSLDMVALLSELVTDANFETQQELEQITLDTQLIEAIVATHSDLLKKALENVIRNALHHTPAQQQVVIQLWQENKSYHIEVRDSGPGIPPDMLEKIFEPFFRLDESRQRETGGYGLGLSIAKRAVVQHGGSITAQNTRDGLCVSIVLPVRSG